VSHARPSPPSGLAALVALGLACACGPSAEAEEAARVKRAIDALREANAEADARGALVSQLDQLPTKGTLASAAKRSCVDAFRALGEATRLERKATAGLEPGSKVPAVEVLEAADGAKRLVQEAEARMPACEKAYSDLARAFR
jgi:hypothetical protein